MTVVASRELRNDTAGLVRRAAEGEQIVIAVNGRPVAQLVPIADQPKQWIGRAQLAGRLLRIQADPGLRADLAELAGDTTDDLGPIK
jgi:prevent-host-death family protein